MKNISKSQKQVLEQMEKGFFIQNYGSLNPPEILFTDKNPASFHDRDVHPIRKTINKATIESLLRQGYIEEKRVIALEYHITLEGKNAIGVVS